MKRVLSTLPKQGGMAAHYARTAQAKTRLVTRKMAGTDAMCAIRLLVQHAKPFLNGQRSRFKNGFG
jgi:cytochrome c5